MEELVKQATVVPDQNVSQLALLMQQLIKQVQQLQEKKCKLKEAIIKKLYNAGGVGAKGKLVKHFLARSCKTGETAKGRNTIVD